jgi:hypothetical protein
MKPERRDAGERQLMMIFDTAVPAATVVYHQ